MKVTVEVPKLRSLVVSALARQFPVDQAESMADVVMFGELSGRTTHGVIRVLPGRKGPVDETAGPFPSIDQTAPAAARITGSPGMLVASLATQHLIDLAGEHGFAVVTTTGSNSTSGSLTYYMERLANANLVAIAAANCSSLATAPGGLQRMLGTNPLSIAIPADGYPFIADMATTVVTYGDVVEAASSSSELPVGAGVGADGEATTDPAQVLDGGALLTFGGHKGLGLSMAVELLAGAIAGADAAPVGPDDVWGHVFVAFSLSMLGDPGAIRKHATEIMDRLAATPVTGDHPIRIPGHRSLTTRDAALDRGMIDVDESTFTELVALVQE